MFEDYLIIEDHMLRTKGLEEYHHSNFVLDFGEEDILDIALEYMQEILSLIVTGQKRFEHGDKISMFCCMALLVNEGDELIFYEPEEKEPTERTYLDGSGQVWEVGLKKGLHAVMKMFEVAKNCGMEKDELEALDLSLVCSISENVGVEGNDIILERKYPHMYHSGWIVSASQDQGNPGAFRRLGLDVFNRKKIDILPYLCLPVGSKVCLKQNGEVTIDLDDICQTEIAWDEPEEVWVHHNTVETGNWIVSAYLPDASERAPDWEWLVCQQIDQKTARICSIPFLSHNLNYGDIVEVNSEGVVKKVVHKSKNATVRIQSSVFNSKYEHPVLKFLYSNKNVTYEWMNDVFVAINFTSDKEANDFLMFLENFPEINVVSYSNIIIKNPAKQEIIYYAGKVFSPSLSIGLLAGILVDQKLEDRLFTAYGVWTILFLLFIGYFFITKNWLKVNFNRPIIYQIKFFLLTWLTAFITIAMLISSFANAWLGLLAIVVSTGIAGLLTPRNLKQDMYIPDNIFPPSPYRHAIHYFTADDYIEIIKEEDEQVMITSCIDNQMVIDREVCFTKAYSNLSSQYQLLAKDWTLN